VREQPEALNTLLIAVANARFPEINGEVARKDAVVPQVPCYAATKLG